MAQKILLLSLSGEYGTIIGKIVAEKLGRGFLNIDDQIVEMLSKLQPVPAKQGIELFKGQEKQTIQNCLNLDQVVFFASYGLFIHNRQFFQSCKKIYVRLKKEQLRKFNDEDMLVNNLAFADRDKLLNEYAEKIDADVLSPEKTACEIIKKIRTKV